jgi:hypothetical protein
MIEDNFQTHNLIPITESLFRQIIYNLPAIRETRVVNWDKRVINKRTPINEFTRV